MSSDQSQSQSQSQSSPKIAEGDDDGSGENGSSKLSKNSNDDSSDDSPSSIAEEIGDNDNDTANDDDIDNISERDANVERSSSFDSENAISTSTNRQCNNIKEVSPSPSQSPSLSPSPSPPLSKAKVAVAAAQPTTKPKSATGRFKPKPDQMQKASTVIKAKTSSPVNSNNKLAKSNVKQVSILQSDASNNTSTDKKRSHSMEAAASASNSIDDKNSTGKSIYGAPPASPTSMDTFGTLKTDLPGRVSFSKNDVYEIDYSDIDNDTDTSRSYDLNETFRKKNVHFEDDYFNKFDHSRNDENEDDDDDNAGAATSDAKKSAFHQTASSTHRSDGLHRNENRINTTTKEISEPSNLLTDEKDYYPLKCNSLRCKADMRLDVLPEDNENGSTVISNDSSEKIIEDYKREIESINRQHELERRWNESKINGDANAYSEYLNNMGGSSQAQAQAQARLETKDGDKATTAKDEWHSGSESWSSPNHETNTNLMGKSKAAAAATASNTSDESPTRDSASTVINNYLKITNQKSSNPSKPSSATIKLKTTKKLPSNTTNRKIKSAQTGASDAKPTIASNRLTKAKSVGHLQRVTDIKLSEFQIDKVESWMSTHEDTFSDTGLNSYRKYGKFGSSSNLDYKKTWRETPTSKTDDEGNYSLDDQVDNTSMDGSIGGGGIELVLKKLEGRRMQISFGNDFFLELTDFWTIFIGVAFHMNLTNYFQIQSKVQHQLHHYQRPTNHIN